VARQLQGAFRTRCNDHGSAREVERSLSFAIINNVPHAFGVEAVSWLQSRNN